MTPYANVASAHPFAIDPLSPSRWEPEQGPPDPWKRLLRGVKVVVGSILAATAVWLLLVCILCMGG